MEMIDDAVKKGVSVPFWLIDFTDPGTKEREIHILPRTAPARSMPCGGASLYLGTAAFIESNEFRDLGVTHRVSCLLSQFMPSQPG